MRNYNLARTILSSYNHLERLAGSIDKMIDASAIGSFYVSASTFQKFGVEAVTNRIIELSARKVTLINLKILIEDALSVCKPIHADLISQKYFERKGSKEIVATLNMAERTYFRKLCSAMNEFMANLERLGYNEKAIFDLIKDEKWLMRMYEQNVGEEQS